MIEAKLSVLRDVVLSDDGGCPLYKACRFSAHSLFKGVSIDSRSLKQGNLFFALVGQNVDGHDYIDAAIVNGAAAVVVQKQIDRTDIPFIYVKDVQQALWRLAGWWRCQSKAKFIAITGSNGKTTTKEMLANILSQVGKTNATKGNLNNDLGVPLTLCQLAVDADYAVIEMGANHVGEIAQLCSLVQPDVGIITNAHEAHLGEFGSIDNIVKAKGELYQALKKDGIAIVQATSPYVSVWQKMLSTEQVVYFGKDVYADKVQSDKDKVTFDLHCPMQVKTQTQPPAQTIPITLNLIGKHHIDNALAAAATALVLGVTGEAIKRGLAITQPTAGRLTLKHCGLVTFIDDTYNANPTSAKKALDTLMTFDGDKIAVLGSMGELGKDSAKHHREVGDYARDLGIKKLYSIGDEAKHYGTKHFDNIEQLAKYLKQTITTPTTILAKASRFIQLERLINKLDK